VFDSLWSWATKPEKEKRRAMYQLAFDRIHHLVWQKHHGKVKWIRIDSHIDEKLASNLVSDERKARIRANLSSLGDAAVYFKMLNEGADALAKRGAALPRAPPQNSPVLNIGDVRFAVSSLVSGG
jgi:hypothetical protein